MATFFRFLGRILRMLMGNSSSTPTPAPSAQPSVSLPTQPAQPNQPPSVTPGGTTQPPRDPLPAPVPPQDDLAGIDIPGFPDPDPDPDP
ncbi:MAG: hypothetical protein KAZ38_23615, partial [Caldilineaceae bacterium]|nr:hypothetical protein [Caldilineaceae bacterium]